MATLKGIPVSAGISIGRAFFLNRSGVGPLPRQTLPEALVAPEVDRLERAYSHDSGNWTTYDVQAWYGRDFNRLVLKAEGQASQGRLQDARTELLWGHAVAAYWDTQLGVRFDQGEGKSRQWLAVGIQGLAPYWFELGATAYLGNDNGKVAVYSGVPADVFGVPLHSQVETTDVNVSDLQPGTAAR